MEPRDERILHHYLEGRLSASESRDFLDRMKDDPDFKERLEHIAKAAPTSAWTAGSSPRYQTYGWDDVQRARRAKPARSRWSWMFLLVMIALLGFQIVMQGKGEEKPSALDELASLTLRQGLAHLVFPHGEHLDRPRVFEALVPKGTTNVIIRVRQDGSTVFEREARAGEPGVDFEPLGERSLHAIQVMVPFPDETELPLPKKTRFEWLLLPSAGTWSAPTPFTIR